MKKCGSHWIVLALLLWGLAAPAAAWGQAALADPARAWRQEWSRTDFGRHAVELAEIVSGGPPRDGIPPLDRPAFVSGEQAAAWLELEEPVLVFAQEGDVRAYPLQILIWHEIVNDEVGGRPVVVTFCPLCNSALVFDRRAAGRVLDFGTTGKLRHSDLVMWDRQTESWWQQLIGEAIVGELTGTRLTYLPAPLVSFRSFREAYPDGRVLSRETGFARSYGANPYRGYDRPENDRPFLFRGPVDARLPATERVVALELGGQAKGYPYAELAKVGVVNDTLGGVPLVVLWQRGTRSALDGPSIADSRDVGAGVAYDRRLEGRTFTFRRGEDGPLDAETGSRWNLLGQAVAGPLRGKSLRPLVAGNHFAFAWLAFRPQSAVYRAP